MKYIARLRPALNPLQSSCFGDSLPVIRDWSVMVLSPAGVPPGTRVDIYEIREVLERSYVKQPSKEGEKSHAEVIESLAVPGNPQTARDFIEQKRSGAADASGVRKTK